MRAHTLRYQNSNVGTAGGAGGPNTGSGFTDLVGYGSGDSRCVFMSECVAFLRQMLHSSQQFKIGPTVRFV